jgi:hypothetical protein
MVVPLLILAIVDLSRFHMGNISPKEYDLLDIMKDLQVARHALDKVKKIDIVDPNDILEKEESSLIDSGNLLEWLEEDSEAESFTLVQNRKQKKKEVCGFAGKFSKGYCCEE